MFQGNNQFYYHTDHLGSATLVTDDAADVVQQIAYMPYGEDWIDVRSSGYFGSAYKFNGKEKDPESGLYYAGARYYNPKMGSFNTTDELWHLSPDKTSYHYCANNPIMFVDPDGRDPIYAKNFWGKVKLIGDDGKNSTGSYLVRGSVAREVKKATKAGEFYTGNLSQSNNVMHIPTGALLDAVIQSVQETERSKRENGGHQNFGESVIRWDEGRDPYITGVAN